jgi:hypothetical protein
MRAAITPKGRRPIRGERLAAGDVCRIAKGRQERISLVRVTFYAPSLRNFRDAGAGFEETFNLNSNMSDLRPRPLIILLECQPCSIIIELKRRCSVSCYARIATASDGRGRL